LGLIVGPAQYHKSWALSLPAQRLRREEFPTQYIFPERDLRSRKFRTFVRGDRIEHERQNRAYLVGETFTVADLTAAALLAALLQRPEIQYPLRVELSPYLKDYRATLLRHPAAQWAVGIYRLHRGYSAEIAKRTAVP